MTAPEGERIQKVLAAAGVGSRRAVERLIEQGRIRVNGRRAAVGARIDTSKDVVEVDGSPVPVKPELVYYVLNKPAGVVTTASDELGRVTVVDIVDVGPRIWPVGRLDRDTEGLIVLTNDGTLTERLSHPRFEVPKTYVAEVSGAVSKRDLARLNRGVDIGEARPAAGRARLVERSPGASLIEVVIAEGRNREVRRMLEAIGHPVRRLVRTSVGPLMLGRLKPGTFRRLSPDEVRQLYRASHSGDL